MQAAPLCGSYDLAEPMVFEESVADRDAVWSLCQAPIYEPQKRPLGFWSKALPSSVKEITAAASVTDKVN